MIAGPNGSGKSTLTALLIRSGLDLGEYLNADDVALTMKGDAVDIAQRAQQIVREARIAALEAGRDHAFETVMSHPSHIDFLRRARLRGFSVRLFYVCTDAPAINVERVASRVRHGGHPVPRDRVLSRYARSLANLPAAIAVADTGRIFDNSFADEPLRPLAEIAGGRVAVHPDGMDFASIRATPDWWIAMLAVLPKTDRIDRLVS